MEVYEESLRKSSKFVDIEKDCPKLNSNVVECTIHQELWESPAKRFEFELEEKKKNTRHLN